MPLPFSLNVIPTDIPAKKDRESYHPRPTLPLVKYSGQTCLYSGDFRYICSMYSNHTMILRLITGLICLSAAFMHVFPQEADRFFSRYNFHYLTERDGMISGTVNDIMQDSDGFMWIATPAGICRYDGYQMDVYNTQGHSFKLRSSYVTKLCEDAFHRLWIGTEDGLEVMNLDTYTKADVLEQADSLLHNLTSEYVYSIYRDKKGYMWISAGNGLWCVKLNDHGRPEDYWRLEEASSSPIAAVSDMGERVCAGLDNQIYILEREEEHRLRKQPLSGELKPFSDDWRIACMQEDGHRLWLGTNRGLFRYDVQTHEMVRYRYSTHRPGMLSQAYITDIKMTGQGHVIVSTLNGLNVYCRETDSFEFIRRNSVAGLDGGSINCDAIHCLYTMGETIWVGTETGGVNLLTPRRLRAAWWNAAKFIPIPGGNPPVNAIGEDQNGNLWIGLMERGLVSWNPESDKCRHYVFAPDDETSISNNTINGLLIDTDHYLWAYTWGVGINKLDLKQTDRRFHRYTRDKIPTLHSDFINSACEDTLNNGIWFGSTRGVLFYDKRTGSFDCLRFDGKSNWLGVISALRIDRKHRLWVGTTQGLWMVDLRSFARSREYCAYVHFKTKLDDSASDRVEKISCIWEDEGGTLWFGGNGSGLYRMRENENGGFVFTNYTVRDGLPDNAVNGMTEDGQGNLWITTPDGFCRLNVLTMAFTNYTTDDGLPATQYYGNGIHYSSKYNRIYLATNAGLLIVRPDETLPLSSDREVKLSAMSVEGNTVRASSVTLHESESRFSVRLTTCDYGETGRIRYAYRMKGYETEWNETRSGDNMVRYTAIPPGDYVLQVCATDELGKWSDKVTELEVHIIPYFYKSFWFYVVVLLAAGAGAWLWYRWKMKRYKEQRAELERKVKERTQELAVQNRQLEAMAEQVKEATEEKISFFTNITHEFRTPVTLIHGPIEQALRETTDGRTKAWLRIAERNSDYLLSLVNELMDFRKLDMDKVILDRKSCDITRFFTELLLPFRVFAKERGVEIRLYERVAHPYVLMDVAYMRKALVNLVANAVKFTPDYGRIDVFVASVPDRNNNHQEGRSLLYINVCDTGYGIVEEDIDRIFDRFYQSKANDSHPVFGQSGTGIGLFLCRRIVELHGGKVYARNNHGKGASFRILMPMLQGKAEDVPDDSASHHEEDGHEASVSTDSSGNKATILVVEDNKDMRDYICMLLSGEYRLLEAENGETALQIVQKQSVDLIVSDLMMPVMDGMEFSARVKENFTTSHIPFLMLTALTSEAQQKKSFEIGVDEYLCKPFDEEVLRLRIRNMLRLRDSYKRKFSVSGNVEDLNIKDDSRDRQFMSKAIELMDAHYTDAEYDLERFVHDMGYSKTLVNRKMQALAGQPIGRFMKGYRLNVAKRLLLQGAGSINVSEVAYAVGFNDPKYFTRCYKEFFGHLPSEETDKA